MESNDMTPEEHVRLALIEEKHRELDHYLRGNGKPGKIADIEKSIFKVGENVTTIKEDIHKLRTSVLVIVATSGAGVGTIVTALLGG